MNLDALINGELSTLSPKSAIIFYSTDATLANDLTFATVNEIKGGIIQAGIPADRIEVAKLMANLSGTGATNTTQLFLPKNVVAYSPNDLLMAWYRPAEKRRLVFKQHTAKSGTAPLPPTLFIVSRGEFHCYALMDNKRPDAKSEVYFAPYYNLIGGSLVCQGNTRYPETFGINTIPEWERAFYHSAFTTAEIPEIKHVNPEQLWAELTAKKHRIFPFEVLKSTNKQLADLLAMKNKNL